MSPPLPTTSSKDIIAARATAAGAGAIAIIRVSGAGCHDLLARIFSATSREASPPAHGAMTLGNVHRPGDPRRIDQGFAVCWHAPRSYTGEDMFELHCHGSAVVLARVLDTCIGAGARLAAPGEFTRRAFLNGKMDLAQAEAVADLVVAHTEAAGRAALSQLGGGLSRVLGDVRRALVSVAAELEARVDFPEEGIEFALRDRLSDDVAGAGRRLAALEESARRGRRLREGARVVLAGRPNAGKSSLFNAIVGRDRALVTPHPGTTRDSIEAEIDIEGIPVTLVDTAGLREEPGEIELMGIERTREELHGADLVVFVLDATAPPGDADAEFDSIAAAPHIAVVNKSDLQASGTTHLTVSALTRDGIVELERAIADFFGKPAAGEAGIVVTNARHAHHLAKAREDLADVVTGLAAFLSPEFLIVDLTSALAHLDAITGRSGLDEDILDEVFGRFCLGK